MNAPYTLAVVVDVLTHLTLGAVVGWALLAAVRWMIRQSAAVGYVVAAGILIRAILGLSLFWISYLELPVLQSLQLGNGFWSMMVDASGYYQYAVSALDHGIDSVDRTGPSPFFVKTLAVWMAIVGVSPAAALFLNLSVFVALLTVLVRLYRPVDDWRRDLPLVLAAAAFSFSPMMIINSTQPLKDDVFVTLVAAVCIGALLVLRPLVSEKGAALTSIDFIGGLTLLAGSVYAIGGIRAYFAVIVWAALMVVVACFARRPWRAVTRYAGRSVLLLSAVWLAYAWGAGPYYSGPTLDQVTTLIAGQLRRDPAPLALELSSVSVPDVAEAIGQARSNFVASGGATNIVNRAEAAPACSLCIDGVWHRARVLAVGVAAIFVPISVLKTLSVVQFSGGRGLLAIADIDTIVFDVTVAWTVTLLFRRRHAVGDRMAFALFAATLASVVTLLLAYVVTNYGTLVRMRLMIAIPLWVLMLALADARLKGTTRRGSPPVPPPLERGDDAHQTLPAQGQSPIRQPRTGASRR